MLVYLAELAGQVSVLNVFRYITFRTGAAVMTASLFVFLFGPAIISSLRVRQGKGQPIRADGPQSHILTKKGTPTMGGLMILSGFFVSAFLWGDLRNPYVWTVILVTFAFGAIGFYDDFLKVTRQSHAGFSGRARLGFEFVVAGIAAFIIMKVGEPSRFRPRWLCPSSRTFS